MFPGMPAKSVRLAAAVLIAALWAGAAHASELVMFEQPGCGYCQRWDRDVGALYGKTAEARAFPLRRVDIASQKQSGIVLTAPVRFTPTFVMVDNGREVGRITGYANDDTFWGLFGTLTAKLAAAPGAPDRI
jgi:cytochrome c551/c552